MKNDNPKNYYYTYYSYEEWGRGYIGMRGCDCLPEEDINYLGSSKDKTFKPTQKIILCADYKCRSDALRDEIILQNFYEVDKNPHFANKAKATSTGFYYCPPKGVPLTDEQKSKISKSLRGIVRTEEYKKKMSERLTGREIKPEWIAKMKENLKPAFGEDNPFYGKSHTEKTRKEISQSLKDYYTENQHPWIGRKHSEESKAKFRKINAGENNPNYGKITPTEVRNKIGQSKVGRKLWNNGEQQKFSKECPGEGWILGGLKTTKEA